MKNSGSIVTAAVVVSVALLLGACSDPDRVRIPANRASPPAPQSKPSEPPPAPQSEAVVRQTTAPATRVRPEHQSYRVRRGDTLFSISQRNDVPLAAMIDANDLQPPFNLRVGQELRLPSVRVHEVRRGETLYAVARQHDLEPNELAERNRLEPPYSLWVGQRLYIPDPSDSDAAEPVDVSIAEAAAATEPAGESTGEAVAEQEPPGDEKRDNESASEPAPEPAPIAEVPARAGGRFLWPVEGEVLAQFGPMGDGRHNDGINIAAARGTSVRAAENGVVAYAGNELRGFGNLLLLKHSDNWVTAYAHNDQLLVRAGDTVERGQPIARVGASGSVGRPQLHFEVRKGTQAIDPMPLLDGAG